MKIKNIKLQKITKVYRVTTNSYPLITVIRETFFDIVNNSSHGEMWLSSRTEKTIDRKDKELIFDAIHKLDE